MLKLPETKGKILYNFDLSKITWFGVGGKADIVFFPYDIDDLQNFLKNINNKIPITILGGCSNVLIRDAGINGIVIFLKDTFKNIKLNNNVLEVDCGVLNTQFFHFVKNNKISNYEFLGTIPGTIGGAIRGNAGCYGFEIKDFIISIEAINFFGKKFIFSKTDCNFEYRKNNLPNNLIFTKVNLIVNEKDTKKNIEDKFNLLLKKRQDTQPQNVRTCGSTFKNCNDKPVWKIIQELGYQNKLINGVLMSEKHANFMINQNANAKNLEDYGNMIKNDALQKMNINLEWEINILGKKYNHSFMIARFQPFHNGHKSLIDKMLNESRYITIVLGSSQESRTEKNPWSVEERKQMIINIYGKCKNIKILSLKDLSDDDKWYDYVINFMYNNIGNFPKIDAYYCGSKYDSHWYDKGDFNIEIFDREKQTDNKKISATEIRNMIKDKNEEWKKFIPTKNIEYIEKTIKNISIL